MPSCPCVFVTGRMWNNSSQQIGHHIRRKVAERCGDKAILAVLRVRLSLSHLSKDFTKPAEWGPNQAQDRDRDRGAPLHPQEI